jgi:hypothetical protein
MVREVGARLDWKVWAWLRLRATSLLALLEETPCGGRRPDALCLRDKNRDVLALFGELGPAEELAL